MTSKFAPFLNRLFSLRFKPWLGAWSLVGYWFLVIGHCFLAGCSEPRQTPEQRADAAKALFAQTTTNYHAPSATAKDAEKTKLLKEAAAGYEKLLKMYPEQEVLAAQAMRNLAGIRAEQGRGAEAVKLYAAVETKYPKQEWEILMAWKAAGDLLWESGQKTVAKEYYKKIVDKYDKADVPQVVQVAVRGSKLRLAEASGQP